MIILAATPIGNRGDASPRLMEALRTATVIAAEDTRVTVHLMKALGVENRPRLIPLHEHNETAKAAELIELARDVDVLVLSDAGMPACPPSATPASPSSLRRPPPASRSPRSPARLRC